MKLQNYWLVLYMIPGDTDLAKYRVSLFPEQTFCEYTSFIKTRKDPKCFIMQKKD